ncbi:TetR/AcrR family transcriptional regulator [Prolixibacteraceae bacterium]|nr:TetR/AcrR family transcriptional regulator [Prolixibacteraceae bacterium]
MKNENVNTKKDAVRENILTIAQDIFSKYGYKKTTLDDIANAVRKGKSSLYYYFDSKEDIFQEVIKKEADILRQELSKVLRKDTDPEEKLRDYILTKITTYRQLANFYNAIENDTAAVSFVESMKATYDQEEIRMMKRILLDGARRGRFAIQDFTLAAIGITTAVKGLELPLSAGTYKEIDLEKSVDAILQILCYGIMKR